MDASATATLAKKPSRRPASRVRSQGPVTVNHSTIEIQSMTAAARRFIESFATLSETDRHEVLIELLRRNADIPYVAPSDEELLVAADTVFQELDRRESRS